MYSLWLSWKHLVHKPAQLVLNLVLLALSTGLIAGVFLFDRMITERLDRNLADIDLVIGAKGSPLQLILSGMYHLDAPTGNISLQAAKPFLRPGHPLIRRAVPLSLGDSYQGYRIVGTDTTFYSLYGLQLAEGRGQKDPMDIVAGASVAKALGLTIGHSFQSVHGLDDNEDLTHDDRPGFHVTGILKPNGSVADQLLLTPLESVWMVHDHGHEGQGHDVTAEEDHREITTLLIQYKVRNHLTLNLPRNINENTDMMAASPAMEMNRLYALMGAGTDLLRILAWIILAVSGLSIFVSLYSSLQARRYELALLRMMGSSPGGVFRLIMQEGFLLAFAGGLLGLGMAHLGLWLTGRFLEDEWHYAFDAWVFLPEELWLFLAVLGFGIIAALFPAWQARKVDIASTLIG
ncbi:MAG: ABC transporter permease [Saprospiraceae bacterium]|nr:ABC transporter permease [Saprospiraceae bacterium]